MHASHRSAVADDPDPVAASHRPRVHVAPIRGWLNDPNGLIHWRGHFHMFFQSNPREAAWGAPDWGHAVSDDLATWTIVEPALTPAMPPAEPDGCWTGMTILLHGRPVAYYTGVKEGVQGTCRAYPEDDDLMIWHKDPANPILVAPAHEPVSFRAYRDPWVWQVADGWRMIVGTSLDGEGDAFLYRSDDGKTWTYLHPLVAPEHRHLVNGNGAIWECPVLIHLDGTDVLILGAWEHEVLSRVVTITGTFEGDRFVPHEIGRMDHGAPCFYAPQTMRVGDRWIAFGWLQEQRTTEACLDAGWAGAMSLPRDLGFAGGIVTSKFVPELRVLRNERTTWNGGVADERAWVGVRSATLEIEATVRRGEASRVGLEVLASDDGREATTVWIDFAGKEFTVDKTRSSLDPRCFTDAEVAPHPAMRDEVKVHLYLDGSVLEVIVDDAVAMSTRAYPTLAHADRVALIAEGGTAHVDLQAWTLHDAVRR